MEISQQKTDINLLCTITEYMKQKRVRFKQKNNAA